MEAETVTGSRSREAGVSMIEVMLAGTILLIGSLGMIGLVIGSIAMNNRSKVDSTQTMLAGAILEQINSTIIGVGTSNLIDCDGTTWTIETSEGGATIADAEIDFTESYDDIDDGYKMQYVVRAPCTSTGELQGIYDVRWNLDVLPSDHTVMLTVGAKQLGIEDAGAAFAKPVHLRVMAPSN